MATWAEFAEEAPELARAVRERFAVRKHATMATLRRDGSPRISGTEVEFDDDVRIGSMGGARKARDLRRDPRVAIHSPTVDPPPGDESAWPGEAKLAGHAVEAPAPDDGSHRFRIDLDEVVLTTIGVPADHLVIKAWHPGRGVTRVERR